MFTHTKAINYKGIESVELPNLGQLNVVCGKNSSGKSTILQALNLEDNRSLGFTLERSSKLINSYNRHLSGFTSPNPYESQSWFNQVHQNLIDEEKVLYEKDILQWVQFFEKERSKNQYLANYQRHFTFERYLTDFFVPNVKEFKSCLIPPKRTLRINREINLAEDLNPNGHGVVIHLFLLKNQEIDSNQEKSFRRIHSEFKKITGCSFNITPNSQNKISVSFKDVFGSWRTSEQCGLGLSDLLIIITFIICTEFNFYLIEEPENHLHADFQRKLLNFFKEQEEKQFLLSTHSSTFIDHDRVDKIFYAWFDGKVNLSDQSSPSKIISELGFSVSEKLTSDALVLVEGPNDIPVLKHLFGFLGTTDDFNIKFWPLGGDIMSSLDLSVFDSNPNTYALVDKDPKSTKHRKAFLNSCKNARIKSHQLERYSMENYFNLGAIRKAFPSQIPKSLSSIDPAKKVDDQISLKGDKSIKSRIPAILKNSTLADFEGTDLLSFIKNIDESLRSTSSEEPIKKPES